MNKNSYRIDFATKPDSNGGWIGSIYVQNKTDSTYTLGYECYCSSYGEMLEDILATLKIFEVADD